jgi:hypothetical protein
MAAPKVSRRARPIAANGRRFLALETKSEIDLSPQNAFAAFYSSRTQKQKRAGNGNTRLPIVFGVRLAKREKKSVEPAGRPLFICSIGGAS